MHLAGLVFGLVKCQALIVYMHVMRWKSRIRLQGLKAVAELKVFEELLKVERSLGPPIT